VRSPEEGALARVALRFTAWAERWFPDAFVFVAIAVVAVAAAALLNGAPTTAVTRSFGDGFWSLITFTMQMVFVAVGGYVVASSPPAKRLILRLAQVPRTGRGAVGFTFLQLLVHLPVVLFLLWFFARTLPYVPPVVPQ
jgi:short-chain fatty acids transporter